MNPGLAFHLGEAMLWWRRRFRVGRGQPAGWCLEAVCLAVSPAPYEKDALQNARLETRAIPISHQGRVHQDARLGRSARSATRVGRQAEA